MSGAVEIPPGMVEWHGGDVAPADWDGGPYLCRDGKMYHMRGYGWGHGTHCWNPTADWDRIAYTPTPAAIAAATPSQNTETGR